MAAPQQQKAPFQLSASECQEELAGETDLSLLRALVAGRRVLRQMAATRSTGKLEGDVHDGALKSWRYPQVVHVAYQAGVSQALADRMRVEAAKA